MQFLKRKLNRNGFTLIELIIYMGLVAIIGTFLSEGIYYLSHSDFLAFSQNESLQNNRIAMEIMTRYIHKADSVITPASAGGSGDTLVISVGGTNITFAVSADGRLQMQEGTGTPINLTDNQTSVSINFTRIENLSTKPTIRISLKTDYRGSISSGPSPTYELNTTVGLR